MASITDITFERLRAKITLSTGLRLEARRSDPGRLQLECGAQISESELMNRLRRIQADEGYEAALNLLDISARTRREISRKLSEKGYLPEVVAAVIQRLEAARLVDDQLIAEKLVEAAVARGKGEFYIKQKLRARGIEEAEAQAALSLLSGKVQADACLAAARRLMPKYENADARAFKTKLSQALARRGFDWDSISGALERLISDPD